MSSARPTRQLDPWQPQAVFQELEPDGCGSTASILTVLLTARECPWRCLMCDLWKSTNSGLTPIGAIPRQIEIALASVRSEDMDREIAEESLKILKEKHLSCVQGDPTTQSELKIAHPTPPSSSALSVAHSTRDAGLPVATAPTQIKLYNSGSFFDPTSIPPSDYPAIATLVARFERVVVECHPRLVGRGLLEFQSQLRLAATAVDQPAPRLEVAMGLETAHPEVLLKLNKRMTLNQFRQAVGFLTDHQVDARAFILLRPPFLDESDGIAWACKSIDFAFDAGVRVVSVIPTRSGNPDLDSLAQSGTFTPPRLSSLEKVLEYGLSLQRGIVLADLWDLGRFSDCSACYPARRARLEQMNLTQRIHSPCACSACGH